MENEEKGYNGWTNYETWAVALWLGNEQATSDYWDDVARNCLIEAREAAQVESGTWTIAEAATYDLAAQMKEDICSGSPLEEADMYTDLLNAALSSVDWDEIAGHLVTENADDE